MAFERRYLSRQAIKVQLRMQLQMYTALLASDVRTDATPISSDWCTLLDQGLGSVCLLCSRAFADDDFRTVKTLQRVQWAATRPG